MAGAHRDQSAPSEGDLEGCCPSACCCQAPQSTYSPQIGIKESRSQSLCHQLITSGRRHRCLKGSPTR